MIDAPAHVANHDTGVVDRENPWPGLASFRETDQAFFHGRDAAIVALTELVARARASVLYGASGLGKTSLIQAGLFPRVRKNDLFPVRIRLQIAGPDDDPAEQVRAALLREAVEHRIEAPTREGAETLWEFFYRKDALWWNERHRIVTPLLVFDQFEEIFTIACRNTATASAARQFLMDLRGIILGFPPDVVKARCDADPDEALRYSLSRSPVRVLFSFREDYLAEFLELRDLFPAVADNDYRLLRMSTTDALRVILNAGGHLVDEPVARRMVDLIAAARSSKARPAGELSVDPALLSVFCRELNNERRSLNLQRITEELLKDKQATILENFYNRSLDGLDPRVRVFIEDELLLPDSSERNSVAEQVALRRPGVTAEALESLINRRLLRRDERDGPPRIELTHDVLIEPVRWSRDVRQLREAEEQRLAAQREAEERSRQAASRRRLKNSLGIFAVLALLAGYGWYRAWIDKQLTARALATAGLVQASAQYGAQGRNDIALAYLGYAVRRDENNLYARGKLIDFLLHRTWPLPVAVFRHKRPVLWAQFSPDGSRVLTVAADEGLRVWPAGSTDGEGTLLGGATGIGPLASGPYLLAVTAAGDVQVWDVRNGRSVRKVTPVKPEPLAGAVDRTGTLIATAGRSGAVRLWRFATSDRPTTLDIPGNDNRVSTLQFSDDGTRLLTLSIDGTVRIRDTRTGGELVMLHETGILAAQLSPNGSDVVTASAAGHATLWRTVVPAGTRRVGTRGATVQPVARLPHGRAVRSAQFSPDGGRILTASDDDTARVWDAASGGTIGQPLQHRGDVVSAFFNADGSRVVTLSEDKSARVWDAESGAPLTEPMWHERGVGSAMFSPDGERVITASRDGTAVIWDVRPGIALPNSLKMEGIPYTAQFNPDGRSLLVGVSGSADRNVRVWNTATNELTPPVAHAGITAPEFNADGTEFVTVTFDGTAQAWTAATAAPARAPMKHEKPILAARFSPNGEWIATVDTDGQVRLWNARTEALIGAPLQLPGRSPIGDDVQFASIDFSRDSRRLAVGGGWTLASEASARFLGNDARSAVWDLSRVPAALIREMSSPRTPFFTLTLHPDGQWLLAVGGDTAFLWPVQQASRADAIALSHDDLISSGRFSPKGNRIVTASEDSTAKLWKHPPGAATPAELQHPESVSWADFSPDGLRVVTTSRDGTARLWDADTGDTASLPMRHDGAVPMARFSADGERLVTVSEDGFVRIWDVPLGTRGDGAPLALLAEAMSGYSVADDRTLTRLELNQRLERQRQAVEGSRGSDGLAARIVKWILEDRSERTISPFSTKKREAKAGGQE